MPKSSCQTGEKKIENLCFELKKCECILLEKGHIFSLCIKTGAAAMWEIPNRFSECYRHKTNLSLKKDNWASL